MNGILAIILVGFFPALTIYQHYNTAEYTREGAVLIAEDYLKSAPTFNFDGIEDSIEVVRVETLRMPNTWGVTIEFTSRHGGYGDRTGQVLTEALEDHSMYIVVSEGQVIDAVTDSEFDEMTGSHITGDNEVEEAKDVAFDFLSNAPTFSFDGIAGTMEIIDIAIAESYPVQYFITITFDCSKAGYGDRTDMMLAQVITTHEARVVVVEGELRGAVLDGVWDEVEQIEIISNEDVDDNSTVETMNPEFVRDISVGYVILNVDEFSSLESPESWTYKDMTPEGLLGYSTHLYTSGNWEVKIGGPVVLEPTYTVEVKYMGESELVWNGSVEHSGEIVEN